MAFKIKQLIFEEDTYSKILEDIHDEQIINIKQILPLVTPGTELRDGLDEILKGNLGGLIVLGNSEFLKPILKGGFDLDIPFSAQKLFELSKMDGAIVLSNDLKRIIGANKHLMPDKSIPSSETGMRHRSAEQTAIESKVPVIAISHRRTIISLYYRDQKYLLQDNGVLILKANYAVNNLKDYRKKIDKKIKSLYLKEINSLNNIKENVIDIIQNILFFKKHQKQVDDFIIELGTQGFDIANTLYETIEGIDDELMLILRDYSNNFLTEKEAYEKTEYLKQMDIRKITDIDSLANLLEINNFLNNNLKIYPRGFSILKKIGVFDDNIIDLLIKNKESINFIKNTNYLEISKIPEIDINTAKLICSSLLKIYNRKI